MLSSGATLSEELNMVWRVSKIQPRQSNSPVASELKVLAPLITEMDAVEHSSG